MISLIEEPSPSDAICDALLAKLTAEATLPVKTVIMRLEQAASLSQSLVVCLCEQLPSVMTCEENLETFYDTLLALPVPCMSQLLQLSKVLSDELETRPISRWLSLKLSYNSQDVFMPTWVLKPWQHLRTMISHRQAWQRASKMLADCMRTSGSIQQLAEDISKHMSLLPFDSPLSQLSDLRTSKLPDLISHSWLSEDHIHAGVDLINRHPKRPAKLRVLNSYFIPHAELSFERHGMWIPRSWSTLDQDIAKGVVNELLIPVHSPSHWTQLYINLETGSYAYSDTLDLKICKAPQETIDLVNKWLSCILNKEITLLPSPRPFKLGQQLDSNSCGVAVLSSMAHYALGGNFHPWFQTDAEEHRLKWMLRFLEFSRAQIAGTAHWQPVAFNGTVNDLIELTSDYDSAWISQSSSSSPVISASAPLNECIRSNSRCAQITLSSCSTAHTAPLVQSKLPFKRISREEWQHQEKQRYFDHQQDRQDEREQLTMQKANQLMNKREYERNRKRAQRERKKKANDALNPASIVTTDQEQKNNPTLSRQEVSALSRPYSVINLTAAKLEAENPGKRKRTAEVIPTQRINWCQGFLWSIIERTAQSVGPPFSPVEIVRKLQLIDPVLFGPLRPQRISQWRDHSTHTSILKWTDTHLRAIEAGCRPTTGAKSGGIFENRQDVVQEIKQRLTDLRSAGIVLTMRTIRGYMVGVIQHRMPEALMRSDRHGNPFRCSDRFIQRFLHKELNWSIRKATRAAQKHPPNVGRILLHAFLRFACVVRDEGIPACCIVNADQTQVIYNPGTKTTWNSSGDRQVHVVGAEDKRAFTLLVGASGSGDILPFQAVYAGKSARSLPTETAPGYNECRQLGFLIDYSETENYWSTFKTMCRWVTNCLAPYFVAQRQQCGLPETQRCILQIDCWTVHRSMKFRDWMAQNYPWIIILYVPGGCTGLFQPCDVGLQRVLKLAIQNSAHNDIVEETLVALTSGSVPQQVLNDQKLGTLRNRSLRWILEGYRAINKPDLVRKSFALCTVPETEHNLSYESLTSHAARQALRDLRATDPDFYLEITSGHHAPPQGAEEPDDIADNEDKAGHTIEELLARVMNAGSAAEAAELLNNLPQFDEDGYESEDESTPLPNSKRPRYSSRYQL